MTAASERLQAEAEKIIHRLDLMNLLGRLGETRVVGSVALGLVVKFDIDIHTLLPEGTDPLGAAFRVTEALLSRPELLVSPQPTPAAPAVAEVRLTDFRRDDDAIKVGIDRYPGPSGIWSLDLWLTTRLDSTAFGFVEWLSRQLTPERRAAILALKRHYHALGLLRDGLSPLIYRAVVESGIRTVSEFEPYAAQAGRNLTPPART